MFLPRESFQSRIHHCLERLRNCNANECNEVVKKILLIEELSTGPN